jgi:hypothetical protein
MAKICYTLTDVLGVKPTNINIYDACHGRAIKKKSNFVGLPKGCKIKNKWGGSSTLTSIPSPWKNGRLKATCLEHLVNNSVDIHPFLALAGGLSDAGHDVTLAVTEITNKQFTSFSERLDFTVRHVGHNSRLFVNCCRAYL